MRLHSLVEKRNKDSAFPSEARFYLLLSFLFACDARAVYSICCHYVSKRDPYISMLIATLDA